MRVELTFWRFIVRMCDVLGVSPPGRVQLPARTVNERLRRSWSRTGAALHLAMDEYERDLLGWEEMRVGMANKSTKYVRLHWKHTYLGKEPATGYGNVVLRSIGEAWIEHFRNNSEWPYLVHWLEDVKEEP